MTAARGVKKHLSDYRGSQIRVELKDRRRGRGAKRDRGFVKWVRLLEK
jgi:hypothetical protein